MKENKEFQFEYVTGALENSYIDENQKEKSLIENSTSIFFKKLNEILKKSNCKEKFYLLYGGNDLGAFLLDEKQFEIIKERYKGNSGDIPYLP